MNELKIEAVRRAMKYEEKSKKIREEDSSRMHKKSGERKKERKRKQMGESKRERNELLRRIGMKKEEIKRKKEEGCQDIVQTVVSKI